MTNKPITKKWIANFQAYCAPKQPIFERVLDLALRGEFDTAKGLLVEALPFKSYTKGVSRYYEAWEKLKLKNTHAKENRSRLKKNDLNRIFERDFYQCRYTGVKLLSLEAIDLLKTLFYLHFPFPSYNGAYSITHIDVWTFYPQIDHIIPLKSPYNPSINSDINLATVSSAFNIFFKGDLPIADFGITLIEQENLDNTWDGLLAKSEMFKSMRKNEYQQEIQNSSMYYEERLAWAKANKKV